MKSLKVAAAGAGLIAVLVLPTGCASSAAGSGGLLGGTVGTSSGGLLGGVLGAL